MSGNLAPIKTSHVNRLGFDLWAVHVPSRPPTGRTEVCWKGLASKSLKPVLQLIVATTAVRLLFVVISVIPSGNAPSLRTLSLSWRSLAKVKWGKFPMNIRWATVHLPIRIQLPRRYWKWKLINFKLLTQRTKGKSKHSGTIIDDMYQWLIAKLHVKQVYVRDVHTQHA